MKKIYIVISLIVIFSCSKAQNQKTNNSVQTNKELVDAIKGEWMVITNWAKDTLIFEIQQPTKSNEEFSSAYNTISFNTQDSTIKVNTYGTFSCGTAASQNLEMYDTKWKILNNQLHIAGSYSDYSGKNTIDKVYTVVTQGDQLKLVEIK
ncbi:MAG: hypothetical protein AB8B52_10420 [Winogradskyella sp.]|uniref:hypothetical protein n=1 Tax=Winogradskyella sp. TaxID=1883156 RepID=UPI00385F602A